MPHIACGVFSARRTLTPARVPVGASAGIRFGILTGHFLEHFPYWYRPKRESQRSFSVKKKLRLVEFRKFTGIGEMLYLPHAAHAVILVKARCPRVVDDLILVTRWAMIGTHLTYFQPGCPSTTVMYRSTGRLVNRCVLPPGIGHWISIQSTCLLRPRPSTMRGSCEER